MKKRIVTIPATAAMFVSFLLAMTLDGRSQNIENGVGVICDSPQQVEQIIALRTDFKSAVEEINEQNKSRVIPCRMLTLTAILKGRCDV